MVDAKLSYIAKSDSVAFMWDLEHMIQRLCFDVNALCISYHCCTCVFEYACAGMATA